MSRMMFGVAAAATATFAVGSAAAQTVRIAEHRQARIDALESVIPGIEERTGVDVEVVEYPEPDREYLSKLLTELAAGSGPDVFSLPNVSDLAEFSTAGYLAPVTEAVEGWDGWEQVFPVARELATSPDGEIYIMPQQLSVQQLYFRRDLLEAAGISTEQPATWDELLERARQAQEATGGYGLLLPMGVTWGGGAFGEGFLLMLPGSSDPELVTADGKLNLTSAGVGEVLGFYETLVTEGLLPVDPLLGPEPWAVPKYQMFPDGELLITTCGSWCYIGDWGPQSQDPIPNVEQVVGTWATPGREAGRESVLATVTHPFAVSANAADVEAATQVLLELGSVETQVAYSTREGNLPSRADAAESPEFQALTALVPILAQLDQAATVESAPGFTAVSEGVARATEALLLGNADAAGAQAILVDYVRSTLGDDAVQ
jgi:multiple sugar transport system substrate-binding protein